MTGEMDQVPPAKLREEARPGRRGADQDPGFTKALGRRDRLVARGAEPRQVRKAGRVEVRIAHGEQTAEADAARAPRRRREVRRQAGGERLGQLATLEEEMPGGRLDEGAEGQLVERAVGDDPEPLDARDRRRDRLDEMSIEQAAPVPD